VSHKSEECGSAEEDTLVLVTESSGILRHAHWYTGDRGSTVVKVLCYKRKVDGSIPDGVIGIFH